MSEKTLEISHSFNKPWQWVCRAYLAKYPHPMLSHVESIDTLERYVDSEGRLITIRVLTSSFLKFGSVAGFEQSIIDPKTKTIRLSSHNLTHRNFSSSTEVCNYSVVDENTTLYTLSYRIKVAFGLGIFISPLMKTIHNNFNKGISVLDEIMKNKFENAALVNQFN